jgi:hypothetical protein
VRDAAEELLVSGADSGRVGCTLVDEGHRARQPFTETTGGVALLGPGELQVMPVALSPYRIDARVMPGSLVDRVLPGDGAEHVQVFVHGLQDQGEVAHRAACSSRPAARARSSGMAWRYQLFRYRNNWYYSDSRVIPIPAPLPA